MNYNMTTPCPECPFRNDRSGYLTRARAIEIIGAITDGQKTFTCHKTTVPVEDDDGECDMMDGPNAEHCAGALILLEKLERPNQMMRIAERLGMYDRTKLDMKAPVVSSAAEFVRVHGKADRERLDRKRRRKAG